MLCLLVFLCCLHRASLTFVDLNGCWIVHNSTVLSTDLKAFQFDETEFFFDMSQPDEPKSTNKMRRNPFKKAKKKSKFNSTLFYNVCFVLLSLPFTHLSFSMPVFVYMQDPGPLESTRGNSLMLVPAINLVYNSSLLSFELDQVFFVRVKFPFFFSFFKKKINWTDVSPCSKPSFERNNDTTTHQFCTHQKHFIGKIRLFF